MAAQLGQPLGKVSHQGVRLSCQVADAVSHPLVPGKRWGIFRPCCGDRDLVVNVAEVSGRKGLTSSSVLFAFHDGNFLDFSHVMTRCKMSVSGLRVSIYP